MAKKLEKIEKAARSVRDAALGYVAGGELYPNIERAGKVLTKLNKKGIYPAAVARKIAGGASLAYETAKAARKIRAADKETRAEQTKLQNESVARDKSTNVKELLSKSKNKKRAVEGIRRVTGNMKTSIKFTPKGIKFTQE